jgi:MFS family permease
LTPSRPWPEWFKRGSPPAVRHLLWFALSVGLGRAVWSLLFNLYLRQVGFREDFIGDLNFWMALASALVAPLAGLLSNRLGRRTMLLAGAALEMIALLASVWFVQRGAIVAAMALSGIAFPLWIIAFNPLLAENTAPDERVSLFSLFNIIWLGTAMAGSLLGGWLPGLAARLGLVPDAARGLAAAAESAAAYRLAATAGR